LPPDDGTGKYSFTKKALAVLDIYAAIKNEQSQDGETKLSGKAISDTLLQTVGKESENWV